MISKRSSYKLADIIDIIGGGTPKTSVPHYWNGDIPWLSVKDFNNDERYVFSTEKTITQEGFNSSSTKMLLRDDIIISARGTVGELAMVPFPMAFNQSCYGIRGKKEYVNQTYLYYLLKDNIRLLKRQTHGSVFDTITRETFSGIEVKLPSVREQREIADVLTSLDDKISLSKKINNHLPLPSETDNSPEISFGRSTLRSSVRRLFSSWLARIRENSGSMESLKTAISFAGGMKTDRALRFA